MYKELAQVTENGAVTGLIVSDGETVKVMEKEEAGQELLLREQDLFPVFPALLTGGCPGKRDVTERIFETAQTRWLTEGEGRILACTGLAFERHMADTPDWFVTVSFFGTDQKTMDALEERIAKSLTSDQRKKEGTFLTVTVPIEDTALDRLLEQLLHTFPIRYGHAAIDPKIRILMEMADPLVMGILKRHQRKADTERKHIRC